jgi:hypothetical protein
MELDTLYNLPGVQERYARAVERRNAEIKAGEDKAKAA